MTCFGIGCPGDEVRRKFRVVYVTPEKPVGIDAPQKNTTINYNGEEQTVHFLK